MNILVTGATGFVAGHLVPRLAHTGHHVVAAGHDPARLDRLCCLEGVEPLVCDLRQDPIGHALPSHVQVVVHLAQANVPFPQGAADLFEVNVGSTQRLLEYGRRSGVQRFILASTGSVYGSGQRPWREEDPANGPGYYAATKLAAERLVQAYGGEFATTIFRLFFPYGPGQRSRLVPGLLNRVRTGQAVSVRPTGGPHLNPVYVTHVVELFEQALSSGGHQLVNLGGDETLSIRDMAETIGRALGREPVFEPDPGTGGGDTIGDIARLRQLFRLPPRLTSFSDGIRSMLSSGGAGGGLR